MTTATAKKITIATVKSFIRKNRVQLLLKVESNFDGMQDMVTQSDDAAFRPAEDRTKWDCEQNAYVPTRQNCKNSLDINGVWFTNGGDFCKVFETDKLRGFEVSNCCGNWIVAVKK